MLSLSSSLEGQFAADVLGQFTIVYKYLHDKCFYDVMRCDAVRCDVMMHGMVWLVCMLSFLNCVLCRLTGDRGWENLMNSWLPGMGLRVDALAVAMVLDAEAACALNETADSAGSGSGDVAGGVEGVSRGSLRRCPLPG